MPRSNETQTLERPARFDGDSDPSGAPVRQAHRLAACEPVSAAKNGSFASRLPLRAAATGDTALLSLLLFLLAIPAAGLPLLLDFAGSRITSAAIAAIVVSAAVGLFVFRLGPTSKARVGVLLFCVAVALVLCALGGEGRFFLATDDWIVRDALINDLVSQPWPFDYRIEGSAFVLRAPLAMYMLPAALGKIFGVYGAHLAMLAQNTAIFALIFYFLAPRHFTFAQAAAMVVIFAIFSGLDVVGESTKYLSTGVWAREEIERWTGLFQYSSHITQVFWVPHHAIGGWSFACLFVLWHRGSLRVSILACASLYLAFWSPFAVMGGAPFLLYAALANLRAGRIDRFDVAVVLLAALPTPLLWLYLLQGSGAVEHGFLVNEPDFWRNYFAFILLEFLLYVWLIVKLRPVMMRDLPFLIVAVSLLLIPFYKLGGSDDFAMRASIPALALLATMFGTMFVENAAKPEHRVWTGFATVILMIGAITGAMEIRHALARAPSPISNCDLVEAWKHSELYWFPMTNYLVRTDALPPWLRPRAPIDVPPNSVTRCVAPTRSAQD